MKQKFHEDSFLRILAEIGKMPGAKKLHEGQVAHMLGTGWKWKDAAGVHVRYKMWKGLDKGVLVVEMDGAAGDESLWGELDSQIFRAGQSIRFKK